MVEGNTRFKIRAYLRLAELSDEKDRQMYLDEAACLLEEIGNSSLPQEIGWKREECSLWILDYLLPTGRQPCSVVDKAATEEGFSKSTIRRAKDQLKRNGDISYEYVHLADGHRSWWMVRRKGLGDAES